ncbi:TetR/AcrR family transcriptional regulator [Actinomadura sp. DC4]|uniref:TetR/AcrR family transcriptional regulator n=1 Tax=Actinomadura sp. DC4 TaxID=3055069 RepID=UPI0025B248E8|nr:TetR/AcrR family transcriptional regulator [Actinomadura sp. DC4]MDN3351154.1 helix-turn-helix domain-containing protein [Actinomadura sp. DC4]
MAVSTTVRRRRGPGRPPKAEAGDTKAALIGVALKLFALHGYAGTSIRAIAREVGLSESVLYAHFDSKRAIYDETMKLIGPQVTVTALDGADFAADPGEFVRMFADRVIAAWDTPQARQVISLISRDGLVHETILTEGMERAIGRLSVIFERWMEERKMRCDLGSAEDLAYALLSPIAHARLLWLHGGATDERRKAARERVVRHADLFAKAVTLGLP